MMRLEDYLRRDAFLYPDKLAVICGLSKVTYSQLYERVLVKVRGIKKEYGIFEENVSLDGKMIAFRTSQSIDFLVEYFAIHCAGGIAVPLEKSIPEELFLHIQNRLSGIKAVEGVADVLFTTGTTGEPKGVMVSHTAIVANAENLIFAQGYHHDLTFIINGPLNHIGSLSKVYPIVLVGGTLNIIDGMKDLNAFFKALDTPLALKGKMATFLVPASIRMLMTFAADRLAACAERIDFIETGAAPIALADMKDLCSLLPKSRLYNTYASTETGIVATYDFNGNECLEGCLGVPMYHSSFFIDEDGRVVCGGKTLMCGYLGDENLTRTIMRDGWVYTADLAEIDKNDRLRLKGRTGDVINVGGYKVSPTEVEGAALSNSVVRDCICIPMQHRVLGTVLKLLVVLEDGTMLDKRKMAEFLRTKLDSYKIPMFYEQVESIRRTFNGKLDRKSYQC